jgi:hypothetical protein
MSIDVTRKAYLEVWGDEYVSRHTNLVDAIESAGNQDDGTYTVRVGSEIFYEVTLQARSIFQPPDPGGDVDTVKPNAADVEWATVPDFPNQPQSTAFSEELRTAYMSGPGAATAVITVELVSGTPLATMGLTIQGGDNLDTPATNIGAAVIRLKATYLSQDFFSNDIVFTIVSTGTDTIAPTAPPMLSAAVISDTQIDIEVLPPCDPKIQSQDADGMDTVEIHANINGGGFSLLTTPDIDPGLSVQLFANTIGIHGTSPSSVQTGADWSLTAEGVDGIDTVSDEIYFIGGDVVGDFDITCKIPSYSAPLNSKTAAQLMIRESIAADSRFISTGRLSNVASSPDPKFSEVKWRTQPGAGVQFSNPQLTLVGDYWYRINRTNNLFSCYIFQQGDTGWTLNRQETINMDTSVVAGIFCNSGLALTNSTVTFEDVCIQNLPVIAFSHTGLTADDTVEYKARGVSL